jgi:hypothetical protein
VPKIGLFPFVRLAPGVRLGMSCRAEHALAATLVPPPPPLLFRLALARPRSAPASRVLYSHRHKLEGPMRACCIRAQGRASRRARAGGVGLRGRPRVRGPAHDQKGGSSTRVGSVIATAALGCVSAAAARRREAASAPARW